MVAVVEKCCGVKTGPVSWSYLLLVGGSLTDWTSIVINSPVNSSTVNAAVQKLLFLR